MDAAIHIGADPKAVVEAANQIARLAELIPFDARSGNMGEEMFKGLFRMFDMRGLTIRDCQFYVTTDESGEASGLTIGKGVDNGLVANNLFMSDMRVTKHKKRKSAAKKPEPKRKVTPKAKAKNLLGKWKRRPMAKR